MTLPHVQYQCIYSKHEEPSGGVPPFTVERLISSKKEKIEQRVGL